MPKNGKRVEVEEEARLGLGARIAIGGAIAAGALLSGFLVSRGGRRLVVETFQGRRRTPLADRVLDTLWDHPVLGRRRLDVKELEGGAVELIGSVATDRERAEAGDLTASVPGVTEVIDQLVLDPSLKRRRVRRLEESSP